MKFNRFVLCSLACFCLVSITACGSKGTDETETVTESDMGIEDTDYEDVDAGYDEYGEEVEETEPGQKLTVALRAEAKEDESKPSIPVEEFKKYGKIVKDKEGFRILGPDGYYISESMLNVDGNCFYFDENGYLKDDVFVPAKGADGEVITLFVHNYSYLYGWVEINGKKYYIDEQQGRLENTSKEIDGELYYFDNIGRSVSKDRYEAAYGLEEVDESEETVEGSDADDVETTEIIEEENKEGNEESLTTDVEISE